MPRRRAVRPHQPVRSPDASVRGYLIAPAYPRHLAGGRRHDRGLGLGRAPGQKCVELRAIHKKRTGLAGWKITDHPARRGQPQPVHRMIQQPTRRIQPGHLVHGPPAEAAAARLGLCRRTTEHQHLGSGPGQSRGRSRPGRAQSDYDHIKAFCHDHCYNMERAWG